MNVWTRTTSPCSKQSIGTGQQGCPRQAESRGVVGLGAEEKNPVGWTFKVGVKVRQELSRNMEEKGIQDEAKASGEGQRQEWTCVGGAGMGFGYRWLGALAHGEVSLAQLSPRLRRLNPSRYPTYPLSSNSLDCQNLWTKGWVAETAVQASCLLQGISWHHHSSGGKRGGGDLAPWRCPPLYTV